MSLITSIRARYLAWSQSTPLPSLPDVPLPVFQRWHAFDASACQWAPVEPPGPSQTWTTSTSPQPPPTLQLLTWNIDASADQPEARLQAILSQIQQLRDSNGGSGGGSGGGPDIVFFQEVSKQALAHLLQDAWVRAHWLSSEADHTNWAGLPFATMTLLARAPSASALAPGPALWRVKYPSRYGRDALCCDVFCCSPSSSSSSSSSRTTTTRLRLVNVHLDSLDVQPNTRPRQVAVAAGLLRARGVGRGLVAGDWNPVSTEDAALVRDHGLVDAWEALRPGEDGFTWGRDGKGAPFPPGRLDKVAMVGLEPVAIRMVHPGTLVAAGGEGDASGSGGPGAVAWSDHSGLLCSFRLGAAT